MMHETIADGISKLEARHAAERAEMDAQLSLAKALVPADLPQPKRIMFADKPDGAWLIYSATRHEALPILEAWKGRITELHAVSDGCLYVGPNKHKRGTLRWSLPFAVEVRLDSGDGYGTAELSWFAKLDNGQTVRCKVGLEHRNDYGTSTGRDWPHPSPRIYFVRDADGRKIRSEVKREYPLLGATQIVKWGGSDKSIAAGYYYDADQYQALVSMLEA